VPERPSLHEVTISHPPGVDFSAQCRGGSHLPLAMSGLYFLGLRRTYAVSSGLLAGVGNGAAFIAEHISTRQ
jgi:hypothetical protein